MRTMLLIGLAVLAGAPASFADDVADVKHPFLLWTKKDLAELRQKIQTEPWAREAYRQMQTGKTRAGDFHELFAYAVMGDAQAGQSQKKKLLKVIDSPHPLGAAMEFRVLAYDLLYDELTDAQRAALEKKFRRYIEYAIQPGGTYDTSVYNNEKNYARYDGEDGTYTRTNWLPNIIFPWKLSANLMAAALRDEQLIRKTWATHGSIKWYFDEYLSDLGFYHEELSKMGSTPGALMMYCTAVRNLGLDELGFGHRSEGGATMRGHIESVFHATFPAVDTGTKRWRFDRMSAGDLRPWLPFADATVQGYFANGQGGNKLWQPHGAWGGVERGKHPQWDGYANFVPKMQIRLWFEWGHKIWPDAGFDWFLAQMRGPDDDLYTPTLYFGLDRIDPAKATPPPIRSRVYPERGFVMLRAQEGPDHWLSPAPAVALRLTNEYAHHVNDQLALAGFYAHNRPIYQNPKPGPGYAFGFDRSIRSHCGIMVDGHIEKQDWGRTGSVEPAFTDDCTTRSDFTDAVKFVAARTRKRYPGVDETRALMLTDEYLFDAYVGQSDKRRSFVWLIHTFGQASPAEPASWKPSDDLATLVKELKNVRTRNTAGQAWQVTVKQVPGENAPDDGRLGKAFWSRDVGVRIHVLGQDDTKAHLADTPKPHGKDGQTEKTEVDGVTIAASRWAPAASFVAVHEPFEKSPRIASVEKIARAADAVAVRVTGLAGSGIDDRLMVRVADNADQPITLADDKERFTFAGHAFVRVAPKKVTVRGDVRELTVKVGQATPQLEVNGKTVPAQVADGVLTWRK